MIDLFKKKLIFLLVKNSKIAKEVRNKERIDENLSKIEDELNGANASLENAIKVNSSTSNDQEKEMKRLEQRESVLKVSNTKKLKSIFSVVNFRKNSLFEETNYGLEETNYRGA